MSKTKQCKVCSKEIASNAKVCPECGANNKKPIYKRVWFWFLIFIIVVGFAGISEDDNTATNSVPEQEVVQREETTTKEETPIIQKEEAPKQEPVANDVPTEYKSALKKATTYNNMMYMSKASLYDQLTSEYGEQFSHEAAQYAVDNVQANWKENALKKAETYQNTMAMSPSAIYDQLISEYGEKFTAEEAQYAIDNLK